MSPIRVAARAAEPAASAPPGRPVKVTWCHLRRGELDHEAIWLAVSATAALFAGAWLALGLPRPFCVWRLLTGIPCVGCGATRCFEHLLRGEVAAALAANPLVGVGCGAVALFDLYAVGVILGRLPRLRVAAVDPRSGRIWRGAVWVALAVNWAYVCWAASG